MPNNRDHGRKTMIKNPRAKYHSPRVLHTSWVTGSLYPCWETRHLWLYMDWFFQTTLSLKTSSVAIGCILLIASFYNQKWDTYFLTWVKLEYLKFYTPLIGISQKERQIKKVTQNCQARTKKQFWKWLQRMPEKSIERRKENA